MQQKHYKTLLEAFWSGDVQFFHAYSDEIEGAGDNTLAEIVREVVVDPRKAHTRIRDELDHAEMVCEFPEDCRLGTGDVLYRSVRTGTAPRYEGEVVGYNFCKNVWREVTWKFPFHQATLQAIAGVFVDWHKVPLVVWRVRVLREIELVILATW